MLTDEFLAMNRKLVAGVEVTPETLAVDVVRDVGPGGDFLAHRHTAKNVRKAQWRPTIINRQGHVRWPEEGGLDLEGESPPQGPQAARDARARAAAGRAGGAHRRAGRRVHAGGVTMSFGAELPEAASVAAVHESALRVLERTGVLVQDDEAVELLRARGARCDGRRVFLDEDLVQQALATAPSSFVLAGRRPELGLPLGGADGRVFGSGSGAAYMLEGRTMRPGTLADLAATAKLGHQLPAIDFNSDCMEPLDLPEAVRTRRGTHARLVASDKAIEWVASVDEDVDEAERINEILFGADWHARPRALIVLNTTAPLQISGETARILLRWARLGQPVCMTSCVMGGTTGPATIAGVLAVQHAEVLATLVLGAGGPRGLPVRLRRPAGDGVAAHRRRPVRRAGVLAAGGRDRAAGAPVRPAGPRRRGRHRRARRGRARDGRVGGGPLGRGVRRRPLPLPGRRHAQLVQRAVAGEVRARRRPDHRRCARPSIPCAPARTTSPRTSSTRSVPAAAYLGQAHTRRHARDFERAHPGAPEPFERWAAAGGEDAVAVAARRVQDLLAAHEPPDDLDAVTRRQLDDYCLG